MRIIYFNILFFSFILFTYGQCNNWVVSTFDDYETFGVIDPYVDTTIIWVGSPETYAVYDGNYSLYMNIKNDTPANSMFYNRPVEVCIGETYRISAYLNSTWTGSLVQCDVTMQLVDDNGNIVYSSSQVLPYSPNWYHFQTPVFVAITNSYHFQIITNISGSSNGNDLTMDNFLVEICQNTPDTIDIHTCSSVNLFDSIPNYFDTIGVWTGPNTLANGYLGYYDPVFNGPGQYTYTVSHFPCSDSIFVVNVLLGNLNLSISDNNFCENDSTTLFVNNNFVSYLWNTGETTSNITVNSGGIYIVTVSDISGCTGSDSINIVMYPNPTPNIIGNDFCLGDSSLLYTTDTFQTYLWSTGSNNSGIYVTSAGMYEVSVTDTNNCSGIANININVIPTPIPQISGDDLCEGNTSVLNAESGYLSYVWNTNDTTQSIQISLQGTYYVTVVDTNNCSGSNNITINAYPNPTPQIIGDTSICEGESTVLTVSGNYASYSWNTNDFTQSINVNNSGTYTVEVVDFNNCIGDTSFEVVTIPSLNPVITGDLLICNGSYTILSTINQYDSYLWNTGETTQSIIVQNPGIYTVTVSSSSACSNTSTVNVDIDVVHITTTGNQTICNSNITTISAIETSGIQPVTYYWSNTNQNTSSISVLPTSQTTYTVYAVDAIGCVSDTETVTISISDIVVLETNTNKDTVCPGDPVLITNNINSGVPPYILYNPNGNIVNPTDIVYPESSTNYQYTVVDACGSTDTETVFIYTYPFPPLNFSADKLNGCLSLTVNFNLEFFDNNYSYIWMFDDEIDENNLSLEPNPTHTFDVSGTYDITVEVTDNHGCKNQLIIYDMITVFPKPEAHFYVDNDVVSFIKSNIFFNNLSEGNFLNFWNFDDGDSSLIKSPTHSYSEIGLYYPELIVENQYGCRDTAIKRIEIQDVFTFYAPTAFTPDNDEINDYFICKGNGIDTNNFWLGIYNRWGELIWETNDIFKGWDGKAKDYKNVKSGVYKWHVIYKNTDGVEYMKTGNVNVIY